MIKIHQDIWNKMRPSVVNLSKHAILFCLTISILWIMIQLTDILFPSIPLVVKVLAILSEIGIIIHFAKDNF